MKRVIIAAEEKPSSSQYTGYVRSITSLITDAKRKAAKGQQHKALYTLDRAKDHLNILRNKFKFSKEFEQIYNKYIDEIKDFESQLEA